MWFNIIGFWAVGFTTGYTLAFRVGWGLPGVWYGILSGVITTGQPPDQSLPLLYVIAL